MLIQMHCHLFVFLCFCLLVTTADDDFSLADYGCTTPVSSELECFGEGGVEVPPPQLIPRDVQVLTISGYTIRTLNTSNLLGTLMELEDINLSNNKIEIITEDSFTAENFPKLKILSLERNFVNATTNFTGDSDIFENLSLQELNLREAFIDPFVKKSLFKDLLNNLDSIHLTKLILSGNDVQILDRNFFQEANSLREIYVSNCNLTNVFNNTFTASNLPQLQLLDLSNNKLYTVGENFVNDLKTFDSNQTVVNLTGNPLECSCEAIDFIEWLKNTSLVIEKELLMCHDAGSKGKVVIDVEVSSITCGIDFNTFNAQYVILSIIFGILGLLALIVLFMRRNDILRFCMQVRQATKDAFDSHQTHYTYSGIQNAKRVTPEEAAVASV